MDNENNVSALNSFLPRLTDCGSVDKACSHILKGWLKARLLKMRHINISESDVDKLIERSSNHDDVTEIFTYVLDRLADFVSKPNSREHHLVQAEAERAQSIIDRLPYVTSDAELETTLLELEKFE